MAIQDCTRFLGKKVRYTIDYNGKSVSFTGRILSVTRYAEGYEPESDVLLFQEDGFEGAPDYISSDHDFYLIE